MSRQGQHYLVKLNNSKVSFMAFVERRKALQHLMEEVEVAHGQKKKNSLQSFFMRVKHWTMKEFKSVCEETDVSAKGRTRQLWVISIIYLERQEMSFWISEVTFPRAKQKRKSKEQEHESVIRSVLPIGFKRPLPFCFLYFQAEQFSFCFGSRTEAGCSQLYK